MRTLTPSVKTSTLQSWGLVALYVLAIAGYSLSAVAAFVLGLEGSSIAGIAYRGLFLGIALLVLWYLAIGKRRFTGGLFLVPLVVFWTLYTIRIALDLVYTPAVTGASMADFVLFGYGSSLIPAIAFLVRVDDAFVTKVFTVVFVMVAAACLGNLISAVGTLVSGTTLMEVRAQHATLNPISFGHLGASLALMGFYGLAEETSNSSLPTSLLWGGIGLGMICTVVAASKGPVLALAVALVVLLGFLVIHRKTLKLFLVAAVLLAAAVYFVQHMDEYRLVSRFRYILRVGFDPYHTVRARLWIDAWEQFMNHPLLGHGLEERNSLRYPHNVVIESFMATGVAGGVAFCSFLLWGGKRGLDVLRNRVVGGWVALLMIQAVVGAMFSGAVYSNSKMWAMLCAVFALSSFSGSFRRREAPYAGEQVKNREQMVRGDDE